MRIIVVAALVCLAQVGAWGRTLEIDGNRVVLDGHRGKVLYRGSGDLEGDGASETVFAVQIYKPWSPLIVAARRTVKGWKVIATEDGGLDEWRVDVTDVNGDGKAEIISRGLSGDGHGVCTVDALRHGRIVNIGRFWETRFRDLDGDRVPEVLSISPVSFMFVGDHWLTIYKWNGQNWTDVSPRFPRAYDAVIRDLRLEIHRIRYTDYHGHPFSLEDHPDIFADLYYYLGKAYEHRGLPQKAREQYAIAYRLDPSDSCVVAAFKRTWRR